MKNNLFNRASRVLFAASIALQILNAEAASTIPTITTQPVGATEATGSNYTFHVVATSSNLNYQWYTNAAPLSGASSSNLVFSALAKSNAGSYSVIVTNDGGSVTSSVVVLVVQDPPVVTNMTGTTTNIIAVGQGVTMTVRCTGDGLGFVWKMGSTVLSGATSTPSNSIYSISSVATSDAGTYTCTVSNGTTTTATATFQLIAVPAPAITTQPAGKGMALGSNYTMSVTASGTYLHYFWTQNATNAVGGDTNKLTLTGAAYTNAGSYSVLVSNLTSTVTSSVVIITVQALPVITNQPVATNILATNSSLTLFVQASGDGLNYQWKKGTTAISGATSSNLVLSSLAPSDAGTYSVTITNFAGSMTSSNALVIPVVGPAITTQPVGKGLALGSNYTLSVTASASYLHYFWTQNATNAVGGDTNKLTLTAAAYTNAGTYSVLVSNLTGTVASSNVILTVQALPVITNQPVATNILATNTSLTLFVQASGDTLHYQWKKGTTAISGATSSNLVLSSLAPSNAGSYSVTITNFASSVTSSNALVIPVSGPAITTQPVGKGMALGSNYTMSVTASASYLHYFWTQNATNAVGGDTNKLTITAADYTNAGTYSVLVSNLTASVASSNVIITVQALPVITNQPVATNILATNSSLTLFVQASGDGLNYQWKKGTTAISGATSSNLVLSSLAPSNAGSYSVTISNLASSVTSSNALVIPVVAPVITVQPKGKGLVVGSNYTLSATVTGSYLQFTWYQTNSAAGGDEPWRFLQLFNSNDFSAYTNVVDHQTNTYTINVSTTNDAGTYYLYVANVAGNVTSSNAIITVQAPAVITNQPVATNILATNSALTLFVQASGDGLHYQWRKGTAAISGATSSNLVFSSLAPSNAGTYSVIITNFASSVTSSNALVIPVVGPAITTQPVGKGVAGGSNYTMSVTASGGYLHYFWTQNATNAVGGDTNKFTITAAAATNAGTYSVLVSNLTGTVTSSNVIITVQVPPAITTQPLSSTNQQRGTIVLTVVATGDSLSYLWTKDGKTATNGVKNTVSTTNTLTITNARIADGGKYQVTVSNTVTSVQSSNATVVVVAPPTLTVAAPRVAVLQSASATLAVTATGTGPISFQWNFDGTNDIANATNATYLLTNMASANAGSYQLTATNLGGSTVTNIIVTYVADTNPPVLTLTGAGATFTNALLLVTGKATDNVAVSNVVFSLDSGVTFSNAVTTNHWTNFVITNTMTNVGTNTLIVKAVDVNANWTALSTNHPVYAPLYTVAVTIAGTGTVSSNWTAKVQWGKSYSATAQPARNYVLVGWSGGLTTNGATLSFSPTNNLSLTATFTTNLFIGLGGTYNGLFSGTNGGTNLQQSGGYLTMTVSTNQTYTGKIYVQGMTTPLSGSFNTDGTLHATNSVTNGPVLALSLSLDFANKMLVGTISNANWTSTNLQADLAVFSASNPTTNAKTYTLVIPTQSGQGLGQGYGSGTVVVATNGAITFTGVAADGTALSQGTTLSGDGYWPLYVGLYPATTGAKANQGLVMGWLLFTNGLPTSTVDWVVPTNGLADSSAAIESSVFISPARGVNRVLTNKVASITFTGAGLTNSFSEIMTISDAGTVATDGQATIKISSSGIISGAMIDPATQKSSKIYGIVLQHDATCLGKGSIAGPSGNIGNFVITGYP